MRKAFKKQRPQQAPRCSFGLQGDNLLLQLAGFFMNPKQDIYLSLITKLFFLSCHCLRITEKAIRKQLLTLPGPHDRWGGLGGLEDERKTNV